MRSDLPLVQVEKTYDIANERGRTVAIFGNPGGILVYVRVPVLREAYEEVLKQCLQASKAVLETK